MKVIDAGKIEAFSAKHLPAKSPLDRWLEITSATIWKNPVETKGSFPSADVVGTQTVFNIGGNKYRLIATISYKAGAVLVDDVLTHFDYDKGDWKK